MELAGGLTSSPRKFDVEGRSLGDTEIHFAEKTTSYSAVNM